MNKQKYTFKTNVLISFTMIELLLVISIIAILASILLPALRNAKRQAMLIGCQNNQKNIGLAHFNYQSDWDGFLVPMYEVYWWEDSLAPYLGFKGAASWQPKNNPGNIFTCPEQPEGNFFGNYPSFARNNACGTPDGSYNTSPRKISAFTRLSAKCFLVDSHLDIIMATIFFLPWSYDNTNGKLRLRHVNKRCNVSFLDGHVKAYGVPPLPSISSSQEGAKWILPGYDAPEGL